MVIAANAWTRAETIGLAELVVTFFGFMIAIMQLRRTATAAEETKAAIERTEERIALNYVLMMIPQFRSLEHDLDMAVRIHHRITRES